MSVPAGPGSMVFTRMPFAADSLAVDRIAPVHRRLGCAAGGLCGHSAFGRGRGDSRDAHARIEAALSAQYADKFKEGIETAFHEQIKLVILDGVQRHRHRDACALNTAVERPLFGDDGFRYLFKLLNL